LLRILSSQVSGDSSRTAREDVQINRHYRQKGSRTDADDTRVKPEAEKTRVSCSKKVNSTY